MEKIYLLLFMFLGFIFLWIKNLTINRKKNIKYYYSWIEDLIFWIIWTITIIWYIYGWNPRITIFLFSITFLLGGGYWIWNRKKIKNSLTYRIDVFTFIAWLISLIPVILYLTWYFDKFNK